MTTVLERPSIKTAQTARPITTIPLVLPQETAPTPEPSPRHYDCDIISLLFFMKGDSLVQATRQLRVARDAEEEDRLRQLLERHCPYGMTPQRFLADRLRWLTSNETRYPAHSFGHKPHTTFDSPENTAFRQHTFNTWLHCLMLRHATDGWRVSFTLTD